MKQNIVFDFNNVPAQWALCFSDDCQLASKCLRHHAAMYVPEGQERLFVINRQATDSQAGCQWFATNEPIQTAYGFKHLYDNIHHKDYARMKKAITALLGGRSNYYRYNSGERSLTPEQQQAIATIMKNMGYNDAPVFEHFRQEVRFI